MHFDDPALRGRLVLMDETSGEIVGELPQKLSVTEDPAVSVQDNEKKDGEELGPVVVELPPDVYDAYTNGTFFEALKKVGDDLADTRDVFVRAIPAEEQNWLTRSATVARSVPLYIVYGSFELNIACVSPQSCYIIVNIPFADRHYICFVLLYQAFQCIYAATTLRSRISSGPPGTPSR